MNQKAPSEIKLHKRSQILTLKFDNANFELSAEFLRVHSPSAEVRGHGGDGKQAVLQHGKEGVAIVKIEAQGRYAIRLIFDDGHDSGIYTWAYLYELGKEKTELWDQYLQKLKAAGKTRQANMDTVKILDP